jgi:hypothetical protein
MQWLCSKWRVQSRDIASPFRQRQPMEKNIMLIVSDETYDKTAAESVKPSSENRHTAARFGEMVDSVIGRV